jgi:hypothetical protein
MIAGLPVPARCRDGEDQSPTARHLFCEQRMHPEHLDVRIFGIAHSIQMDET